MTMITMITMEGMKIMKITDIMIMVDMVDMMTIADMMIMNMITTYDKNLAFILMLIKSMIEEEVQ